MSVNPPEPENFGAVAVTEAVETPTTVEHPAALYLPDLQAVQLEIYAANTEGRKPNFKEFPANAVRAAGYNPKSGKPLAEDDSYEANAAVVGQTPIENESGVVNEKPEPAPLPLNEEFNNPVSSEEFSGATGVAPEEQAGYVAPENDENEDDAKAKATAESKPVETKETNESKPAEAPAPVKKAVAKKTAAKKTVAKKA